MRCLNCHHDGVAVNAVTCPSCGVHLPSAHRDLLPPGTSLYNGKYIIEYALGQGGFGITYRAIQVALNRRVAVKEFFPKDQVGRNTAQAHSLIVGVTQQERFARSLQRFQQEAMTLASLRHPHVVSVVDIFDERSTSYIVMEYLSGRNLRDEMDAVPGRRLPEERVRQIMVTLVDALKAVHAKGVYHLDIKPDNVMVEPDGRIVLIDFGAARQGLTGKTTQSFSPEYAPLEARAGGSESRVGPGSDIFEVGMMLHEMLTGTLPPDAIQRAVDATRGVSWEPLGVPEPWRSLIVSALKIEIGERPSDIAAWWNAPPAREPTPVVFTDPPITGDDVRVSITITEGVVLVGGHVPVTPPNREKMAVYVPPGVREGQELRITGQGKPGQFGGKAGDLIITVRISASTAKGIPAPGMVRPSLQTVSGDTAISGAGNGYNPPPSANPTGRNVIVVQEYQAPIWRPVIITLLCILIPTGAVGYYYAPTWVPKYAPGLAPYLPNVPKTPVKPPKPPKTSGKKSPKTSGKSVSSGASNTTYNPPPTYDTPPPAPTRVTFNAASIEGAWQGRLGNFSSAELRITATGEKQFTGDLSAGDNSVKVRGSITANGVVSFRETGIDNFDTSTPVEPDPPQTSPDDSGEAGASPATDGGGESASASGTPTVWHLGSASGQLRSGGKSLSGRGSNKKGGYSFSFTRS